MTDKVFSAIQEHNMLGEGEAVTVALSGGADSTALLLCLKELGYGCRAVHINHNLRGEEALRDQHFCEDLCARLGIELKVISADVKGYCKSRGLSAELGARELRYKYFEDIPGKIATAHTLSDSVETALFNLTRGCGIKGLTGIPPVRGKFIRPLINCTRADVEAYLRSREQGFVTDSTNLVADCSRNIIRLKVIPELKKINPAAEQSFLAAFCALREADRMIDSEVERLLKRRGDEYDLTEFTDGAAFSRAVIKILEEQKIEPSKDKTDALKEIILTGGKINLKKGIYAEGKAGKLRFTRDTAAPEPVRITLRENAPLWATELTVTKISPFDIFDFNNDELRFLIDESKMADMFTARTYRGSERIALPKRGFSSEIKKLLTAENRPSAVVIDDGKGAVFVEGVGVAERVCCDEKTVSAYKIDITKKERENA